MVFPVVDPHVDLRVIRAWLTAHHGVAFAVATAGIAAGLVWLGTTLVPGATGGPPIPVWALSPPLFAMVASVATVNALPVLTPAKAVLRWARLRWLLAVLATSCVGAALATWATGLPSIVPATALLVALTFAASTILGRSAIIVGAVPTVVVVTLTRSLARHEATIWLPQSHPVLWAAGLTIAAVGIGAYVYLGARVPKSPAFLNE